MHGHRWDRSRCPSQIILVWVLTSSRHSHLTYRAYLVYLDCQPLTWVTSELENRPPAAEVGQFTDGQKIRLLLIYDQRGEKKVIFPPRIKILFLIPNSIILKLQTVQITLMLTWTNNFPSFHMRVLKHLFWCRDSMKPMTTLDGRQRRCRFFFFFFISRAKCQLKTLSQRQEPWMAIKLC